MSDEKVLDDVAGVTSYDEEIRKADRQRKQVEEYLERIAMIEQEQQRHLADLVEEKKDAEKALKIREDLDRPRQALAGSPCRSGRHHRTSTP